MEEARDQNKKKIPADASFYDQWYGYYKKVEARIFSLTGDTFKPADLSEESVFDMVKSQPIFTPAPAQAST